MSGVLVIVFLAIGILLLGAARFLPRWDVFLTVAAMVLAGVVLVNELIAVHH